MSRFSCGCRWVAILRQLISRRTPARLRRRAALTYLSLCACPSVRHSSSLLLRCQQHTDIHSRIGFRRLVDVSFCFRLLPVRSPSRRRIYEAGHLSVGKYEYTLNNCALIAWRRRAVFAKDERAACYLPLCDRVVPTVISINSSISCSCRSSQELRRQSRVAIDNPFPDSGEYIL